MSEHLRAFVVITFLMVVAYFISKRLFEHALEPKFIQRLFTAGYAATAAMFLVQNIWVFFAALALLSLVFSRRLGHPLALFIFLLLLIPGYSAKVPGFGLINYFIDLNPWRILSVTLLVPAALEVLNQKKYVKAGQLWSDKIVIIYAIYTSYLVYVFLNTFTGFLRGLVESTLDFMLLYFVASRSMSLKTNVRHVVVAFVSAAIFLALVGVFEFVKHWLLYSNVKRALGASAGLFGYLGRGTTLRASATTGQPIVLGFVMMVGFLMVHYARHLVPSGLPRAFLWALMGCGLVAAMSRGPWVGAAVGLAVIALFSAKPMVNLFKLLIASCVSFVALLMLPGGEKILDYLPWVGTVDASNITYRELLWKQTQLVIQNNFWIGSVGFTELPEFDVIRQGGGFVDIVNTYLGVLLGTGVIGLTLYIIFVTLCAFPAIRPIKSIRGNTSEVSIYITTLAAILIASAVTLVTVSSISQVTPVFIFILGAGAGCARLVQTNFKNAVVA